MTELLRRFARVVVEKLRRVYAYLTAPVPADEESLTQDIARRLVAWSIKQVIAAITRHPILAPSTRSHVTRNLQLLADDLLRNAPHFYPRGGPA